jgi:hypothetical protein
VNSITEEREVHEPLLKSKHEALLLHVCDGTNLSRLSVLIFR